MKVTAFADDEASLALDYSSLKCHYQGLDVFRAVSVLMVCAFHTNIHLGATYGLITPFVSMGAIFMTAFFMLSGFSLFVNHAGEDLSG